MGSAGIAPPSLTSALARLHASAALPPGEIFRRWVGSNADL
jgi:hypothetical protein